MNNPRNRRTRSGVIAAATVLAVAGLAASGLPAAARQSRTGRPEPGAASLSRSGWVGSWGAAPSAGTTQLGSGAVTVRNVVHTSLGGSRLRIRLTNAFGTAPLGLSGVTVGLPQAPGSVTAAAGTMRTVTFAGSATPTIPTGAEAVSDPIALDVAAEHDLLVSIGVPADSGAATYHLHATQTNYLAAGDHHAGDVAGTAFTTTSASWFYVSEVDTQDRAARGSVVALGDSITDGVTSTASADHRWPDYLARRLLAQPPTNQCGVLNEGISGNRVLLDGVARAPGYAAAGPSADARLQRDVLSRTAPHTLVVFEGINDIIWPPSQLNAQAIIDGLHQIVVQAHADGIRVVGATISPAGGYAEGFDPQQEATRQAVNAWIRHSHTFDAVADFDAALRDPADPQRISPAYDSGDHLHPNDAGYGALADSLGLDHLC